MLLSPVEGWSFWFTQRICIREIARDEIRKLHQRETARRRPGGSCRLVQHVQEFYDGSVAIGELVCMHRRSTDAGSIEDGSAVGLGC